MKFGSKAELADAIHFLSIFPKSSILARRTAHHTCGYLARRLVNRESRVVTTKHHDDHDNEEGSLLGGWQPLKAPKLNLTLELWAQMKRQTIAMWSSSGLKVSELVHLVELAKLYGDAKYFNDGVLYMRLLKTALYLHAGDQVSGGSPQSQKNLLQSLSLLLRLMVKDQGLDVTQEQLLACLYRVTTNVKEVKMVKEKFLHLVKKYDEVYQREQLLAMLRLCDNPDVFMNLFHQYHLDYGHPLPISAYQVLMRVCSPHYRLYFMLEILHIMIFRHGIKPPKEMFQFLGRVMAVLYGKDLRTGEDNVTMEMCHKVLTLIVCGVEEERQSEVLVHMLPVVTLMCGMEGFHMMRTVCSNRKFPGPGLSRRQPYLRPREMPMRVAVRRILRECVAIQNCPLAMQVFEEVVKEGQHRLDVGTFCLMLINIRQPKHFEAYLPSVLCWMPQYLSNEEIRSCRLIMKNVLRRLHLKRLQSSETVCRPLDSSYFSTAATLLLETLAVNNDSVDRCIATLDNHGTVPSNRDVGGGTVLSDSVEQLACM